ncbi:MAG: TolC family protein [Candidatus Brocadia sp.]|nr:TolC family protein [Candidatus Brocadia sp.]
MTTKYKRNSFALLIVLSLVLGCVDSSFGSGNTHKTQMPSATAMANIEMDSNVKFISMSLKDSIVYALRNSFDIELSKLNTKSTDYDITTEKARFDPMLHLRGSIQNDETPSSNLLQVGDTTTTVVSPFVSEGKTADAIVQSLIPTGATVSLGYTIFRSFLDPSPFQLINPSYTNFIEARITQPLLKGGGWFYNRSPIYIARNNKKISLAQFKSKAIEVSNAVQEAYWNYIRAMENLKVAKKSLERAEDLLRKNKIQVEVGTLAPVEIIDAESGVASRVEAILSAENAIKDREDELKRIMNLADNEIISDATIIPTDKPGFEPKKVELKDTIKVAMEKRPELTGLELATENAGIETRRRKNELYPGLDFTGGLRYTGLGSEASEANDSTFSEEFQGEFFTLVLEVPIGNRSARSAYNKSKLNERQARINVRKKELDIVVDVREAVRQVMTNIERVNATRKARELAVKRLENEEKKYDVGRSTSLEILRAQENLAFAEFEEARAIIDYEISLGNLERAKGTILDIFDIKLEEETKT